MSVVLIPCYKPDALSLALIDQLQATGRFSAILAVDDGSGEAYQPLFAKMEEKGVVVVRHAVNLGKGQALKTGINACMLRFPGESVVAADCDGQHTPHDIAAVADITDERPDAMALGGRRFDGKVPFRSRFGNGVMRVAFFLSTGVRVHDTQTGLRGFPPALQPKLMQIPGARYEYEMNMLLSLCREGVPIAEIPIETVYIENNASSHFHPFRDAMRVFGRLLAFAASSIASYGIDYGAYALLLGLTPWGVSLSYGVARLVSSIFNFLVNRKLVFKANEKGTFWKHFAGYYALALVVLGLGALGVLAGEKIGINQYVSKPIVDTLLYAVSFLGQRLFIFKPSAKAKGSDA